jgi:hypothetical protein
MNRVKVRRNSIVADGREKDTRRERKQSIGWREKAREWDREIEGEKKQKERIRIGTFCRVQQFIYSVPIFFLSTSRNPFTCERE